MLLRNCLLALLPGLFFFTNSLAMRCGDKLVYEGDSQFTVLMKCGEPLYKQVDESEPIFNQYGYQVDPSIETWFYQKSSADFQYELIFNSGVLQAINANRNP